MRHVCVTSQTRDIQWVLRGRPWIDFCRNGALDAFSLKQASPLSSSSSVCGIHSVHKLYLLPGPSQVDPEATVMDLNLELLGDFFWQIDVDQHVHYC